MAQKNKNKELSRRRFCQWVGLSGVAGSMAHWPLVKAGADIQAAKDPLAGRQVPRRTFGRSGVSVPVLSLGGIFNTGQNHVLLNQAVKWGVTYWDTATRYNWFGSEDGIGRYFDRFPDHRQKIFLVTKSPTINAEALDEELQKSLDNLKTDYIDLYFIHKVEDVADEMTDDIRRWAEKAKKKGKIKLFGFSTHKNMAANLKAASKLGWIDGIMTTYNYRFMVDDEINRGLDACHKAGIGLTAMKTQAASTWGHPVGSETDAALKLTQKFLDKGFTVHQARLMAVWSDPRISAICSQMENMTILKENVTAALSGKPLSENALQRLQGYDRATASAYCAGCAHICEGALNQMVPVADVMRYLMYARSYGDAARARQSFGRIPEKIRQQMAVADYTTAEARCPRNMPIARLMRRALDELGLHPNVA